MDFSIISLLVLALVVAVGFIKKLNIGFFSIGAAFLLGMAGHLSAKQIVSGFSSSMFVTLVGVTFLFGMASANGTLDLFSKKIVALVGKRTYLIPILMFVLSAFISAIGPGHIAAGILMTTFAVYLAFELKINPMATALYAKLGANAGCASPPVPDRDPGQEPVGTLRNRWLWSPPVHHHPDFRVRVHLRGLCAV